MKLFGWLRVAATTAVTTAVGVANAASGRIERSAAPLNVGDPAPDFELAGSDGRTYRLSDYRDRQPVVIAWFPKAFTGGCTVECRSMAANQSALQAAGAVFFGASVDDVDTNRRFSDALDAGFPILSDPGRTVARAYGVLGASGFATRRTFYVGTDGRIKGIDDLVNVATHGTDIADRLNTLGMSRQA